MGSSEKSPENRLIDGTLKFGSNVLKVTFGITLATVVTTTNWLYKRFIKDDYSPDVFRFSTTSNLEVLAGEDGRSHSVDDIEKVEEMREEEIANRLAWQALRSFKLDMKVGAMITADNIANAIKAPFTKPEHQLGLDRVADWAAKPAKHHDPLYQDWLLTSEAANRRGQAVDPWVGQN